jgi:GT2 family glycosyltransferase
MVPTYNCAGYLGEALRSVLSQDPGPDRMEVVVVDDCSTADDPSSVVREVGRGRVRFVRHEVNQGHVRTFNHCLSLARGELVHLLHGDDWVEDGFYDAADRAFGERPDLAAFVCRYKYSHEATGRVDESRHLRDGAGVIEGWVDLLAEGQRLQAPSTAVRRAVYERLGGFDEGIAGYGEDWEMWLRVASAGPVWFEPAALAVYRIRDGSLSDPRRLRQNMDDMRRVMRLNAATLAGTHPPEAIARHTDAARRSLAGALLRRGHRALARGQRGAPVATLWQAWRFWPRPDLAPTSARLLARWARTRLRDRRRAR